MLKEKINQRSSKYLPRNESILKISHISNVFHNKLKKIKHPRQKKISGVGTNSDFLKISKYHMAKSGSDLEKGRFSVSHSNLNTSGSFYHTENDSNIGPFINRISSESPELASPYYLVKNNRHSYKLPAINPVLTILPSLAPQNRVKKSKTPPKMNYVY